MIDTDHAGEAVVLDWLGRRSYHHLAYSREHLQARRESVSICVPTRECGDTIERTVNMLVELRESGAVDQVAVVDASSADGTASIAARLGAEVYQEQELRPEFGRVLGKGDAMWRALSVLRGDVVCYLDGDSSDFGPHFVYGLVGVLLREPDVQLVKAHYRRAFRAGSSLIPNGGGRMTELTARPLLNLFYPDLAGVVQPLAGDVAARRCLLERLPFTTGYGVEIGMLIDTFRMCGLDAIAQVDLGARQNRHQPLTDLSQAAYTVLLALVARLRQEGRLDEVLSNRYLAPDDGNVIHQHHVQLTDRPAFITLSNSNGTQMEKQSST